MLARVKITVMVAAQYAVIRIKVDHLYGCSD